MRNDMQLLHTVYIKLEHSEPRSDQRHLQRQCNSSVKSKMMHKTVKMI